MVVLGEHIPVIMDPLVVDLVVVTLENLEMERMRTKLHQMYMEHLQDMVLLVEQEHSGILVIID